MKKPLSLTALTFIALTFSLFLPSQSRAAIRYEVSIANPEQHTFRVSMEIPDVQGELKVQMAAWNALYEIRDFSSHVQQVEAYADGKPADIVKLDKLTWEVKASGKVTIKYATFWDDSGPFNTQLNSDHAFINPAMILMYVPDRRKEECSLVLTGVPTEWQLASATSNHSRPLGSRESAWDLSASSYDALVDGPIEISKFEEFTIHDLSPPVHVVIHGDNYKKRDIESFLRKICSYEIKLMDGAPYDQYTFIFHIGKPAGGGGGGMEHANSTAIYVPSAEYLPNVSAHEYFHLWNVKRIRPASLEPVDYTHEMYTRALWFAEGVTNTYGSYALIRSGVWNKQEFYGDLSSQISEIEARPAEHWQSAEQSSLDAWLEKYALYNQPQRSVSYYTKGQVLGVLLDILIRDRTDNQRSLDDVMRAMNQDFAKAGKFYRDSLDIKLTAEKIAGGSLDDFFNDYVSGAEPLPYKDLFNKAGLSLQEREVIRATLGFTMQREPDGTRTVASVEPDSSAEKAGLQVGDELLRWNNDAVPRRADRWAAQQKPGEVLHLKINRGGNEQTFEIHLGEQRERFFQVLEVPDANDRARRIRDGLLHGTTDPITARAR
ncbi:MAG TPA: PDZ domain-containing protein [Candidatus Acidoferrum sp.]|nr:PDZ domain-containing protein [Candidatus Acidoferrum sp.]